MTSSTRASGAEAPAVTPTVPVRSSGSSSASLTRSTRGQPPARATFSRATVLEELAEPMTTTASDSAAIAFSAAWRLVVAKHRSLRLGIQRSGKRCRAASIRPRHSSWLSVVWASRATGVPSAASSSEGVEVLLALEQADRLAAPPPWCRPPPRGRRGRRRGRCSPCGCAP